jgi:hypothetical protein
MQWIALENEECGLVKRFVRASQVNKIIHLGCVTYSAVFLFLSLFLSLTHSFPTTSRYLSLSQSYPQIVNSSTFKKKNL